MASAWGSAWGDSWGGSWGTTAAIYENVRVGWCLCPRCGSQYPARMFAKEWTGLSVCRGPETNDCWDPKHPQMDVRGVLDRQGVRPNMRPEPADVFAEPTAVTADSL